MESFQTLINHLSSPPWLFSLALMLFLLCRGARLPWTLGGGAAMSILTAALLGFSLGDANFRHLILHPERLPMVVLLLSTLAVLWSEMHLLQQPDRPATAPAAMTPLRFTVAEVLVATTLGIILVLCAAYVPVPLARIADPSVEPAFVKAPWFLAGLQEIGHYFDPWWAMVALPLLYLVGLLGLPTIEARLYRENQTKARGLFIFGWLFLWLWPMAVAVLLRGPQWIAFGPFESWDATQPAMPSPLPLSQRLWIQWLGILEPAQWWIRELPGLLLVTGYLTLLPRHLGRLRWTRELCENYRQALGAWRYYAATLWILVVLIVPLKMASRWLLGVGYLIHIPELSLRF